MPKVCLIVPPSPELLNPLSTPPLGVLYLAAAIEEYNPVIISIGAGEEIPNDFDVYGFTCVLPHANWIREQIKKIGGYTVVGGPHITYTHDMLGADCAVIGEGEAVIKNVIEERPTGLVFGKQLPLDEIRSPLRTKEFLGKYHYSFMGIRFTTIMTSRGCPNKCAYCSARPWTGLRYRSLELVVEEIKQIQALGYNGFVCYDDLFTCNRGRVLRFCELVEPLGVKWRVLSRGDRVDEKMLAEMKKAGCVEISFGIESGSKRILEGVHRFVDPQESLEAVQMCNAVGIKSRTLLIVGLPGEDPESIEESRQWMKDAQPDSFSVAIFMPYPGSDIWDHQENYEISFDKKFLSAHFDDMWFQRKKGEHVCFVSTPKMSSEDLLNACNSFKEDFKELERYKTGGRG